MQRRIVTMVTQLTLVGCAGAGAVAAAPEVGDKAPALTVAKWIGGEPVDVEKADADEVFVLTFWPAGQRQARYYTSQLTELQRQFRDKRVRVIVVTDEDAETIDRFLNGGWRRQVAFTIALDKRGRSMKRWSPQSHWAEPGRTCIVKGGKVIWVGQPREELEVQVAEACGDTEYLAGAKEQQVQATKLRTAFEDEKWDDALAALDKMQAFKPREGRLCTARYMILAMKKKDAEAAKAYGRTLLAQCDDPEVLNELAWGMLTEKVWAEAQDLEFSRAVAQKAMMLTDEKNGAIVDTYARALYEMGDLKGAVEWQKKAVNICRTNDEFRGSLDEVEETLQRYQTKLNRGI